MKEKMISKSNGFKILIITCSLILLIGVLAGCGEKAEDTSENNEEVAQEIGNEDEEKAEVDVAPSEESKEVEPESSEEPIPSEKTEVIEPQTVYEWVNTLDTSEIYCAIWHENTKEGIILENEQEISLQPGDKFICIGEDMFSFTQIDPLIFDMENSSSCYILCDISEDIESYEILNIVITDLDENTYRFEFYLIKEDFEVSENEDNNG